MAIESSEGQSTIRDHKQYTRTFDLHWEHFALQYYRASAYPAPVVNTGECQLYDRPLPSWGSGWEVLLTSNGARTGENAYCGVIGTRYRTSASHLDHVYDKSYEEGGLDALKHLATGGFDIFHVQLHCLTSWQGSIVPSP